MHGDRTPQHRREQVDLHFRGQVRAADREARMRQDFDDQVNIRFLPVSVHRSCACHAHLGSFSRPCGDLHLDAAVIDLQNALGAVISLLQRDLHFLFVIR